MNDRTMSADSHDEVAAFRSFAPTEEPVVPATTCLPEITGKALILSLLLSVVLAGANAYLGLFAGMTVSASIPAAVVSMTLFRLFKTSNILENNIVQTAASSGEALAAGVIFTLPALLILGYWQTFDYWQTTLLALVGGLLGVLFTIPLRRVLILDAKLRFPEGVALRLMRGIATEPGCLACHGAQVAPAVRTAIAAHYPDDAATGFAVGDLRGGLWVEVPTTAAHTPQEATP